MDVKKLLLLNVRFGYEHLWEPSAAVEKAEKKYSLEIRIPKENVKAKEELDAIIDEIVADVKKSNKGKLPKDFKVWLNDGDEADDEQYQGVWYLSAKSTRPVGVFGTQKDENGKLKPIGKDDIKAGDWGNVSIGVFAFSEGNGGVSFFLNGVQKRRDGEAISYGASSADFDDLPDDETEEEDLG